MPERALEPYPPGPSWPQVASGSTSAFLWFASVMIIIAGLLGFLLNTA